MKEQTGLFQYRALVWGKLKQHYQSIILAALVILVIISVIARLVNQPKSSTPSQKTAEETATAAEKKTYTVQKNDNLWQIAEAQYGSGFNAVDIAKANNIKNLDLIEAGQVLTIPAVEVKTPTQGVIAQGKTAAVTVKEDKYTVKKGDHLWQIALQAYGDGYQWVKIAKANQLTNPDVLYVGTVLSLPR